MKIYYKHSIPLTCINHSYIFIHLDEFFVLATISNSWMRSCGSFEIDLLIYFWEVQNTHPYIRSDCDIILCSAREVMWNMQSSAIHFKVVFCVTVTPCEVTCYSLCSLNFVRKWEIWKKNACLILGDFQGCCRKLQGITMTLVFQVERHELMMVNV